jgi:hypothetical protein
MRCRMRLKLIALVGFLLTTRSAAAQLTTSPAASPIGTWRGTSACVVRPSACTDEAIVLRIARKGGHDSLSVDGRKIVDGSEVGMGAMDCQLNASRGYLTCVVPDGKWRFRARRDSLVGQLRLQDGTWVRDVHAIRSREGPGTP